MITFRQHVEKWKNCKLCDLCHGRRKIVFARGQCPADIAFIGEAPGTSENDTGLPFVGSAGHLMDRIIKRALPGHVELREDGHTEEWVYDHRIILANLVMCFPKEQKQEGSNAPPDWAIRACQPRLIEFVEIVQPRLIVCVGALSRDWLSPGKLKNPIAWKQGPILTVDIRHPASIIRANIAQQGLAIQEAVVTIENAVEDYL